MNPRAIRTALSQNRQFVAVVVVVLLVMGLFPGSPGQILLLGSSSPTPPPTTESSLGPTGSAPAGPSTAASALPPGPVSGGDGPAPGADEVPLRMSDLRPFEPQEREPRPTCDTDELFTVVNAIRDGTAEGVGGGLNLLLPGEDPERGYVPTGTLERLVRLFTGCEAEQVPENPDLASDYFTQLFIEGLLDAAGIVPSTGLDPILLPPEVFAVTQLLFDVMTQGRDVLPVELHELLGPFSADVREWCGIVEILLLLAPILVVESAPLDRAQLTRLMAPVAGICGLFDDDSFLDDDPA